MDFVPYIDPEPGALVRQYSDDVIGLCDPNPNTASEDLHQLRTDVSKENQRLENERHKEIRQIELQLSLSRPDDEITLRKIQQELLESMREFQNASQSKSGTGASTSLPASWDYVRQVVSDVQSNWDAGTRETRSGRSRECLRKMCNGLNNHSAALKMFPSETEYTSILSGSIGMILQASSNYTTITESFIQGIICINDAVDCVNKNIYNSPIIQQLTMRLYSNIFAYLTKFIKWFTSRKRTRFLGSFNENLHNTFEAELEHVNKAAELLKTHIQFRSSAEIRVTRLMTESISGNLRHLLKLHEETNERSRALESFTSTLSEQMANSQFQKSPETYKIIMDHITSVVQGLKSDIRETVRSELSGSAMLELLTLQAASSDFSQPALGVHSRSSSIGFTSSAYDRSSFGDGETPDNKSGVQKGSNIQYWSRHMEQFFDRHDVFPFIEPERPIFSDARCIERLKAFTEATESQILYMFNDLQAGISGLREPIGGYIDLSQQAGVPVISYFCQLPDDDPPLDCSQESVILVALVYSLIRQAIHLFPAEIVSETIRFDESRLSNLDGTLRTWDSAIDLLTDCVQLVNLPVLHIVIDGLTTLEDDFNYSLMSMVEQLVSCLAGLVEKSYQGTIKVLFTTTGRSETLFNVLNENDIVECRQAASPRAARSRRAVFL